MVGALIDARHETGHGPHRRGCRRYRHGRRPAVPESGIRPRSRPRARLMNIFKRIFLGRPMSSGEMEHTLLPKSIALPVFASDPLSSNAYATQEIILTLGLAGSAALS